MPASKPVPLPIQYTPVTKEQLTTDAGVAFLNLQLSQHVTTLNALLGRGGPVLYPSGIDMQGARVTGLAAPSEATDAVPYGNATAEFGAEAQQQQLDVGKPKALKGLTYAFGQSVQNATDIATLQKQIALAAQILASGGTTPLSNPIIQIGHTGAIATTLAVTFPEAFPNTVPVVVACDDYLSGGAATISVESASVTQSGFTLHSSGTGNGAWWVALGS